MARKVWTAQIQVDREIMEQLGPNSVPQAEFSQLEVAEMEALAEVLRRTLEQYGYVRMQHEVMPNA